MDDLVSIAVSNAVAATVLALAAIIIGAVYRRPALVHGLWLLVLLKLVTPPLMLIPVAWPNVTESPPEVAAVCDEAPISPAGGPRFARPTLQLQEQTASVAELPAGAEGALEIEALPASEEPSNPSSAILPESSLWPQILRIVWGIGALAWFTLVMERLHHFRRLLRFARPAPAALQERTQRLAQSLGLKYCPRVRLLPGRISPMLWAIGGPPRLLVPVELLGVLNHEQLDTLLVHELAHLRRRDHWVRVLEFVVMGLYWWHPVVWYARRELREAEEQCCDAWVVSTLPNTGRTYASALLDTLDFLSTAQAAVPPLASGLGQIADLKRRLTMIMQGNTPRSLTWPGCLAVITLGLTCLPMLPSLRGQPPGKEEARQEIEEAEKALEKARAILERQRADLAQKVKELAKAQQRVAEESVRKAGIRVQEDGDRLVIIGGDEKAAYRIEITLSADVRANPKEIVAKIRKVLPEELGNKIVVRPVPVIERIRIEGGEPPARGKKAPPQPPQPRQPNLPLLKLQPKPQPAPGTFYFEPQSKSSDKRINDLEKKLEKVLRELQELRKQMKQPHGGPAGYVPPAASAASLPVHQIPPPGTIAPVPASNPPAIAVPPAPPAATPPPPPGNPTPPPDPSARRLPNPYGEYRSMC